MPMTGPHCIVFAITSSGKDIYTAITRIAAASVRITNPSVHIFTACDEQTYRAIEGSDDPLLGEIDEWLRIDTPEAGGIFRNRYVKTRLRDVVDGDFLFLDSDVLVRGDLGPIFEVDADVACTCNHSRDTYGEQVWEDDLETLEAMHWETDHGFYANGGLIFYRDTPAARSFGREWHDRWLASSRATGKYRDQPALNSALHATRPKVCILPHRFNAQFKVTTRAAIDAAVWHYYASANLLPYTEFELFAQRLLAGGELDPAAVRGMIDRPHPWRRVSFLDDIAAHRIAARNVFDGFEAALLSRQLGPYWQRKMHKLRSVFGWGTRGA